MAKQISDEELERDAAESARRNSCEHDKCYPTEWYWSGQVKTMYCPECGTTDWRTEQ